MAGCGGSPTGFVEKQRSRETEARKGSFSHLDCPVFIGKCASANGLAVEEEADAKTKPFIEVQVEDSKSLAPMLFGEKFAKQATTTADQVKATKRSLTSIQRKIVFLDTTPEATIAVTGVEPRGLCKICTSPIREGEIRQASHPADQPRTIKSKELRISTKCCKLSKGN